MGPSQRSLAIIWLILITSSTPLSATLPQLSLKSDYALGNDSTRISYRTDNLIKRTIPPIMVIGVSAFQNNCNLGKNIKCEGGVAYPGYILSDYLQYSPAALMLGLKVCGVEGRSDWARMVTTDVISLVIMTGMVSCLKTTVRRERPDGSTRNSFPSGHTATSFMTASMLHKEYGQTVNPWLSASGYIVATGVGISRVLENRHWIPDVLCGAGIGMLSTELSYDISGALFGDKHLLKPELTKNTVNNWSFSIKSHFCFSQYRLKSADDIAPKDILPGYSLGMEGTRMIGENFGITLTTLVTQVRWNGDDYIIIPDMGSQPALKSFFAGGSYSVSLLPGTSLSSHIKAGFYLGENYFWKDKDGHGVSARYPTAFCSQIEADLNIKTSNWSGVGGYIGMERYGNNFISFFVGTAINLYL